jgi:hypothetical protein
MEKKKLKKYVAPTSEIIEEELEGELMDVSIVQPEW